MPSRSRFHKAWLTICLLTKVHSVREEQNLGLAEETQDKESSLDVLGAHTQIDTKGPMLADFDKAASKLRNDGMSRQLMESYRETIISSEDVLKRAQAFAQDANRLGIPVGYSAQPAFGFFWELVNMVASKFVPSGAQSLADLQSRAFPDGTSQLLREHSLDFSDTMLVRTRADLMAHNKLLSLNGVPEYVDYSNIDEMTNRHKEPTKGHWAHYYNEVWMAASANMRQVANLESALYFMRRSKSGGGSPVLYNAMQGSHGHETAVNLGRRIFAKPILGPGGDYPVRDEIYEELTRQLAELWIKLASEEEAKVLHVVLIAPKVASDNAYISKAFGWLDGEMVNLRSLGLNYGYELQNGMRYGKQNLIGNDELVRKIIQLNQNARGTWSFDADKQLRIRPFTRLGASESQELPGTAPFAFYQSAKDKATFDEWRKHITKIFEDLKVAA